MNLRIARFVLALAGAALPAAVVRAQTPATAKPNPLAQQQQAVHDAQVALDTAKKQVLVIRKRVEAKFVTKPEWVAAKDAMDKAKIEFDMAQRRVTAALDVNPDYKALIARKEKAQAVLDQATNPKPTASGEDPVKISDDDLNAASKERIESALAILNMQKNVGESDTAYLAAKQKYAEARAAYDALELQVDDAIKLEPDYAPAQQGVDQAETALKQAKDQLAAAIKAEQNQPRPVVTPSPAASSSGYKSRRGGGG